MKKQRYNDPPVIKDLFKSGKPLQGYYDSSRADYQQLAWRIGASPYVACLLDNLYYAQKLGDIQVSDEMTKALEDFVSVSDVDDTPAYVINHDTEVTLTDWRSDQQWETDESIDIGNLI